MTKDQFVELASDHVDTFFPKGIAVERGEAMVLIAMVANDLIKEGVLDA